ncbi:MAG: TRAP transporter small permease, partial [Desulforhabdus sp.]|nr:TRAP transporter small permease [Desulforhabdus sp.]
MEGANITIQKAQRRECIASIDKGLSFIASTMSALAGCMMIFIAVVTCYEVVMRAFFNAPTSWVFNLSTVLIASMTMLGAAWALIQGRHIRVDVITNLLPQRSQSALEIIGNVFVTAFGILIAYGSFNLLTRAYIVKMRIIPNVPLVEWPFRAFFCFGALVLAIMGIRMVVSNVATFVSLMGKEGTDRRAWVNPVISALSFIISLVASLIVMTFQSQIAGILMLLVVLIFGGVPIFCALAVVGIFGLFVMNEPITEVARISYASLNTYALICLPLFMLGGQL